MRSDVSRTRVFAAAVLLAAAAAARAADFVPLTGHVLPVLAESTEIVARSKSIVANDEPVTLTVVLRRENEVAFNAFLAELYDPKSPNFRKYESPVAISDRYGPSQQSYDLLKSYFESHGFVLSEGSANRMTLTLRGTRAMAEGALSVPILDYRIGDKVFRANAQAPMLPADLAWRVQAIVGMSNLAQPQPMIKAIHDLCAGLAAKQDDKAPPGGGDSPKKQFEDFCTSLDTWIGYGGGGGGGGPKSLVKAGNPDWTSLTGAGQRVGITGFDRFNVSDVADFLAFIDRPSQIAKLSRVAVNGGAAFGADQAELLLDITSVMVIAPGAEVVVYDAPFTGGGTSFQSLLNAMIGGGVTIISNSWAYCENQTTLADVQSIDALFAAAAASGISAFNASGDRGATCLNGSPDTVHVPASSPNATAVGGSSLVTGPGHVYVSETWWDGTGDTQPTGQGGYGVSTFFARPSYQDGHVASGKRSVPDVVSNADPAHGVSICQASDGGCPTGLTYGGTSMAAPMWAAYTALLNEAQGTNLGNLNLSLYPLANTAAFHNAPSLTSDFAHVGLGSPDLNALSLALRGEAAGGVSSTTSSIAFVEVIEGSQRQGFGPVPADGATQAVLVVRLRDANGNPVGGKVVTVSPSLGSSATVTPPSAITDDNGAATFFATDLVVENVTFLATDTTDALVLVDATEVGFVVPSAAAASIFATPNSVLNDGIATTTITVTLVDALARPTPGKLIVLSQGSGHSIVSGPNPSVTDATGTIVFTATDTHAETVTYTAVDVTDGDLPIPGSAVVDFTGQPTSTCATTVPTAAPGYAIAPWSTGYESAAFFYSNINFGCAGASNPVFDADGSAFVATFPDGKVFHLPSTGGVASSGFLLATHGPTLAQPVFGKDGRLYAARSATGSGLFSGAIYELDPADGSIVRTLVSPATCPQGLAVDPLSGDLFYNDTCFGAGTNDPRIFRISDPGGSPVVSTYATLPGSPSGWLVFAPDGTLYAQSNYLDPAPKVQRITGTDKPQPATVTEVPGLTSIFWLTIGETLPSGDAKSLIVLGASGLRLADITTNPPTFTELTSGGSASGTVGPDGCLYFSSQEVIFRLSKSDGECGFDAASAVPSLVLTPSVVTPDPAQGTIQSVTATFANTAVPVGTAVIFLVNGVNPQVRLATTDASGSASIAYQGEFVGLDKVTATATVGGTEFTSNKVDVHWIAGKHATFLTVTLSPGGGSVGATATLAATLIDVSVEPNAPIAGETIQFTLGAPGCSGVTDGTGRASCNVVPTGPGTFALSATYAGSASYMPSSDAQSFLALAALPAIDVTANPMSVDFGSVAFGSSSAATPVAVVNNGTQAFVMSTIALGGTNPGDFALGGGANACVQGATLAGNGGTCTLYPSFTPTAPGARGGTATITDASTATGVSVALSGTGIAPAAACFTGPLPGGGTGNACVTGALPGCQFSSAAFVTTASVGTPPPAGVRLPFGLFQFVATQCGASLTLTLTYPNALPGNAQFHKFGPTLATPTPHWYTLPAQVAGNTMVVTIADGGDGDSDLAVNGSISDPGGAGLLALATSAGIPVPTLDRFALLALALLLLACGFGFSRTHFAPHRGRP